MGGHLPAKFHAAVPFPPIFKVSHLLFVAVTSCDVSKLLLICCFWESVERINIQIAFGCSLVMDATCLFHLGALLFQSTFTRPRHIAVA